MKRVDFLAWRPVTNASARCRGAAYAPHLWRLGYRLRFLPPAPARLFELLNPRRGVFRWAAKGVYFVMVLLIRLRQILGSRGADVVVIQRELFTFGPPFLERLLSRIHPVLVYDFDDAVDMRPPHLSGWGYRFHDRRKLGKIVGLCRAVIASNPFLADRVRDCGVPVTVLPTPVDTDLFVPRPPSTRRTVPALGWIGTGGNLQYLRGIVPALAVVQERLGCAVVVVSEWDFRAQGLAVTNVRWSLDDERQMMRWFDIGLMPLPDNPYTRAKSGYKILQYWAAGLPVVASPVGFNRTLIAPGRDGLLAETIEDWTAALTRLAQDPDLRERLGSAGREKALREYSLITSAPKLARALDGVTGEVRDGVRTAGA